MVKKLHFFSLLFLCFGALLSAQENYNTLLYKGNQKFNGKDYGAASGNFLNAAKLNPNDFGAHYNLGNAYYKRKMYKEAEAEYAKAESLAKNNSDRAAALYNRGNTHMQTGNQEQAAEFYKKSLKINPYDEAARKNYEIAMLRENEKKSQNQNDKNKSGGGGSDKDKNKDKQDNDPKQQPGGEGQSNQGSGQGSDGQKQSEGNSGGMPKEQQNTILNRVGNKERETAKRILNKNGYSTPESNQKDW